MSTGFPPTQPEGTDPSMEEILASIRKILNEDDTASASPQPGPPRDGVLILDESMMVAPPRVDEPSPAVAPIAAPVTPPAPAPSASPPRAASPPPAMEAAASDLVAPETAAAAATALGSLVRTLSAGRQTAVYSGGPTLEDLVRGELHTMLAAWMDANLASTVEAQLRAELRGPLKAWLDTNLPAMVERLVRAEIERVVGRAMP